MATRSFLVTLLLVVLVGLAIFYMVGGSIDIDADVRSPSVEIHPGRLPDVSVDRAPDAEAGDKE